NGCALRIPWPRPATQSACWVSQSLVATWVRNHLRACLRVAPETRRKRDGESFASLVLDWNHSVGFAADLAGHGDNDHQFAQLALRSEIHSAFNRVSAVPRRRCPHSAWLLGHAWRTHFASSVVWHRAVCS